MEMELEYDCTSPMAKRLLEATKCLSLKELKEYLKNAKQEVVQMMDGDVDTTIDSFVESRRIMPMLAAILAAKNIDSLWIIFGDEGTFNKNAAKCPLLKSFEKFLKESTDKCSFCEHFDKI
jgi:hypothetical protein